MDHGNTYHKSVALSAQDLTWRFYERVKDRLDHLRPVTEEKLRDRRELAKILLKEREIRIEGHIPEYEKSRFLDHLHRGIADHQSNDLANRHPS